METQIIIGAHSIYHAMKNREIVDCIATADGLKEFRKNYKDCGDLDSVKVLDKHQFQEESKKIFKEHKFEYQRIPSGLLLVSKAIEIGSPPEFYDFLDSNNEAKVIALDGVTDIHNAAAIIRSCAFFAVDAVVLSGKQSFGMSPGFFRIASGGAEYLKIFKVNNLSKTLMKVQEKDIPVFALSEHEEPIDKSQSFTRFCLVMGQEDTGISHAVMRVCDNKVALPNIGPIKSLNVSVATALALKEFLG